MNDSHQKLMLTMCILVATNISLFAQCANPPAPVIQNPSTNPAPCVAPCGNGTPKKVDGPKAMTSAQQSNTVDCGVVTQICDRDSNGNALYQNFEYTKTTHAYPVIEDWNMPCIPGPNCPAGTPCTGGGNYIKGITVGVNVTTNYAPLGDCGDVAT